MRAMLECGGPPLRNRSAWWFLLPVFLGVIGAALAWSAIRRDDPVMLKWIMIVGAVDTVITSGIWAAASPLGF